MNSECLSYIGNRSVNGVKVITGITWSSFKQNHEEQTMAVRILVGKDSLRGKGPGVTVNQKLKRLTFNKSGFELLKDHYKGEPEYVQILLDDDRPGVFWLRLVDANSPGAKKLDKSSTSTRSFNISLLIKEMNLELENTKRCNLIWDEKIGGIRADLELDKEKEMNEK